MKEEETVLGVFISLINEADEELDKVRLVPPKRFYDKGLSLKQVNDVLDDLEKLEFAEVKRRPKSKSDKSNFEVKLTSGFVDAYKGITHEFQINRELQVLITYYRIVIDVFDTCLGGYLIYEDPKLNHYYSQIALHIETILDDVHFKKEKEALLYLPDSLLGALEDMDLAWDEGLRKNMLQYLGNLEKRWLKQGHIEFELSDGEKQLVKLTNEAIAEQRERMRKANLNFVKQFSANRKENEQPKERPNNKVKYQLSYLQNRELRCNGVLLAKPDFMSENEQFLDYVLKTDNSNRRVPMKEILEYMRVDKLKKTPHQILDGLNIKGEVRKLFFPNVSNKGIEVRNPITYEYAKEHNLPKLDIEQFVRNSKK